jgi:hypothetical protein
MRRCENEKGRRGEEGRWALRSESREILNFIKPLLD